MVGNAGAALLFFMYLIALTIIGLYLATYAAHNFLTVVEDTAAGNDEVRWPSDPLLDWVWKLVYLAWLVFFWLFPAMLVARTLAKGSSPVVAFIGTAGIVAGLFWLFFPVSLLSSLSASSRWIIFTPTILPRLAQRAGSVAAFYIVSFAVIAGGAVAGYALLIAPKFLLPLGALGVAYVLLVYGRIFGRLAQILRHTRVGLLRPVRRPTARRGMTQVEAAARLNRPRDGAIYATDLPEVNAPDEDARIGYDVRFDDQPAPRAAAETPRRRAFEPPPEPYALGDRLPDAVHRGPLPEQLLNPSKQELELARRGQAPEPPAHPWTDGVFTFPFYKECHGPLFYLTLGLAVFGFLFRLMIASQPG